MNLQDLPDDVLICIIEFSYPHAIESLATTSRRLYSVGSKLLHRHNIDKRKFRHLVLHRQWTTLTTPPPPPSHRRTPLNLSAADEPLSVLGQIAQSPSRGWYVRTLDLARHELPIDELDRRHALAHAWYDAYPHCREADLDILRSLVADSPALARWSTPADGWEEQMLERHGRGALPLLTDFLVNTTTLHYRYNIWTGGNPTIKFLNNAARVAIEDAGARPVFLGALETLLMDFVGNAPKPSYLYHDILRLPKLKTVELNLINDLVLDYGNVGIAPLTIERLTLKQADLRNGTEWGGLAWMPHLTHLSFEFKLAYGHEHTRLAVESLLADINQWLPATIQHLRLTMKCNFTREQIPIDGARTRLPTLRNCHRLKTLQCDVDFLATPSPFTPPNAPLVPLLQILPPSIEQVLLIHREDPPWIEPSPARSEQNALYRHLPEAVNPISRARAKAETDRWTRFSGLFKGMVSNQRVKSSLAEMVPRLKTVWFDPELEHIFDGRDDFDTLKRSLETSGLRVISGNTIPNVDFEMS